MSWPWSELGLDGPASLSDVRHAYAECLKKTHPEDDPEGFQRLHDAYQAARRAAKTGRSQPDTSFAPQKTEAHTERQPRANQQTENIYPSFEENEKHHETDPVREERQKENSQPHNEYDEENDTCSKWKFGELLEPVERPQKRPVQEEKTWDYEQIFREEQQEQADRRRQQHYDKTGKANESDGWEAVDSALQIIYELFQQERPLSEWMSFFYSTNFFRVKGNPDFIIGLEEFLKQAQTLDGSVRRALIRIYGLEAEYVPAIYRPLRQILCFHQLLHSEEQKKRKRTVKLALLSLILGLIFTFAILPRIAENFAAQRMCHYMEEDFGCTIEATQVTYNAQTRRYMATDTPELYFIATPNGRRDIKNEKLGYTTNYGNAVVGKALRDFAAKWHYVILQYKEGSLISVSDSGGKAADTFYLDIPMGEDEACIAELGTILTSLKEEPWYHLLQPEFSLFLTTDGIIYYTYKAAEDDFDTKALQADYTKGLSAAICQYIVEKSGLAKADFGAAEYWFTDMGTIELYGDVYTLVGGVDAATGKTTRVYLYGDEVLYSVAASEFDPEMNEMDYRSFKSSHRFQYTSDDFSNKVKIYRPENYAWKISY